MGTALAFAALCFLQSRAEKPAKDDIERAERNIMATFAGEYGQKDRAGRRLASRRLFEEASGAKDAAERYVLLRDAARMGAEAVELGAALGSLDLMASQFEVDELDAYASAINRAKGAPSLSRGEVSAVAEMCLSASERAMARDRHDLAAKWAEEASRLAGKSGDAALRQAADETAKDSAEAARMMERAWAASEVLAKKDGSDPAAYLELGVYNCAVRWDWKTGLGHMRRGSDAVLSDLAGQDFAERPGPEDMRRVGEGWLAAAAKERLQIARKAYEARGRGWLERAFRSSDGLAKTMVAKRVNKGFQVLRASYGPGGKGTDITAAVAEAFDRDPWTPIRAGDELLGASHTPSSETLTVEYLWNGRRLTQSAKEGEVVVLPCGSAGGSHLPWTAGRFRIVAAHYGAGAKFVDVTMESSPKTAGPFGVFHGGPYSVDPHPGVVKTAVLQYEWHGRRFVRTVRENGLVRVLPEAE